MLASLVLLLLLLLLVGEAVARWGYGLGDPPLTQDHPTIDYLLRPDQDVRRFGNVFQTNAYGMRSGVMTLTKTDPDELRILFLGDSVINGGSRVDQSDLATEAFGRRLERTKGVPVRVGNASTASWAAHNWLAYVEQFGTFEADLAVVLVNWGDLEAPSAVNQTAGFQARFPRDRPFCALHDAWLRFGPKHLPAALAPSRSAAPVVSTPVSGHRRYPDPIATLGLLHERLGVDGVPMLLVYHPTAAEASASGPSPESQRYAGFASGRGVSFVDLSEAYRSATQGQPGLLYRDSIHLASRGHAVLAEVLERLVLEELGRASAAGDADGADEGR